MGNETSSGGTQVVTSSPPSYQLPFLQQGLQGSADLYAAGGPEQYTGNRVVGFAPETEAALAGTTARATNGSPVVRAGQDFVTQGLSTPITSQFGGASNPYLDQTFQHAADMSQNRLSSEFARAGRNVDASAPARADMLSSLAAQIYAPAYENERSRELSDLQSQRANQSGLLSFVNPLAQSDYNDLAALRGVGAEQEGLAGNMIEDAASRFDYEQQRPEDALNSFLQRIYGQNLGQTQTTQLPDVYRNQAGGALGGALAGGSMFGPWGALAGGLAGLL